MKLRNNMDAHSQDSFHADDHGQLTCKPQPIPMDDDQSSVGSLTDDQSHKSDSNSSRPSSPTPGGGTLAKLKFFRRRAVLTSSESLDSASSSDSLLSQQSSIRQRLFGAKSSRDAPGRQSSAPHTSVSSSDSDSDTQSSSSLTQALKNVGSKLKRKVINMSPASKPNSPEKKKVPKIKAESAISFCVEDGGPRRREKGPAALF